MNVLLIGSTGFIGSYLTQQLSHKYTVTATTRSQFDLVDADQTKAILQHGGYDVIINCAAQGRNNPREINNDTLANNLRMFMNLVDNQQYYQRLITFGSGAEFDLDRSIDHASEDDVMRITPKHSYGLSKNIISRLAKYDDKITNLRIFGCFHSSESTARPIKNAAIKIKQNQVFEVHNDRNFDMISVSDIGRVVESVINGSVVDDVNLVYQHKLKLSDIIKLYCAIHGLDQSLVQVASTSNLCYTGNGSKLANYNLQLFGLERSLADYVI